MITILSNELSSLRLVSQLLFKVSSPFASQSSGAGGDYICGEELVNKATKKEEQSCSLKAAVLALDIICCFVAPLLFLPTNPNVSISSPNRKQNLVIVQIFHCTQPTNIAPHITSFHYVLAKCPAPALLNLSPNQNCHPNPANPSTSARRISLSAIRTNCIVS